MTVEIQKTVCRYVGDGVNNNWPVPFAFLQPEHIKAVRTTSAGDTPLVQGTDFTVEQFENGKGRCVASVGQGEQITVYMDVPVTQETDLRNGGRLTADILERMCDKLTYIAQQHETVFEQCVKVKTTSDLEPDKLISSLETSAREVNIARDAVIELRDEVASTAASSKAEMTTIAQQSMSSLTSTTEQAKTDVTAIATQLENTVTTTATQSKTQIENITEQTVTQVTNIAEQADQTLKNANAAVAEANGLISNFSSGGVLASGMILPFYGNISSAGHPVDVVTGNAATGYGLCDGRTFTREDGVQVTTPDLRDRFIVGAGNSYSKGDKGGANSVTLKVSQMPSHAHQTVMALNMDGGIAAGSMGFWFKDSSRTGGSQSHENRPPYYALSYVMKL